MKLIHYALGLVICVVLVGSALIPIVSESAPGKTLDVVVLGGQSNIAYIPAYMDLDVVNDEVPQPSTDCFYYGIEGRPAWTNANLSECALYSMISEGQWTIGGEEAAIASTIASKTNDDVLVINAAIPAYSISQFEPGTSGGTHIQNVISAALALIPDDYRIVKCGWVWCQGESDKTTPVNDYIASFENVASIFEAAGFEECYMVETKPVDSGNATQAQRQIAATFDNVKMASTAPATFTVAAGTLIEGNSLHYSQTGRDIVGTDVGNAISSGMRYHVTPGAASDLVNIIPLLVVASLVLGAVVVMARRAEII